MNMKNSLNLLLLLLLPIGLTACESKAPAPAAPPGPPPVLEEESVAPGANESFLDPDIDVADYIRRFEGESREVAVERDAILAIVDLSSGDSIADIGAGTGLFVGSFSEAVGASGRVRAVDLSPGFIEHLRARKQDEGLTNVEIVPCTDRSTTLPPESCDVVFICDTYHHFEYPRSVMASIREALRPGGRLVIVDFERIPGVTREWLMDHVRAGKEVVIEEIEASGFRYVDEVDVEGLVENYVVRFARD